MSNPVLVDARSGSINDGGNTVSSLDGARRTTQRSLVDTGLSTTSVLWVRLYRVHEQRRKKNKTGFVLL